MHDSAQRIQNNAGIASQRAGLGKDLQSWRDSLPWSSPSVGNLSMKDVLKSFY